MEITVDDLKISYRIFGEGEETAVLLQGWGTTYSIYESIANILSEKMRVVFFDFLVLVILRSQKKPGEFLNFLISFLIL